MFFGVRRLWGLSDLLCWAPEDGTGTGPAKPGEPTQGGSDDPNADAGKELKFSDDDMAQAKASWSKRVKRDGEKALVARDREILDSLEADSFDEIKELLTGKRQEQTELEATVAELKRGNRGLKKTAEAFEELQGKYNTLVTRVHDAAKRDTVYEIAKAADAHEDLVFLKVASSLGVDEDGKVHVLDDDGEPAGTTVETLIRKLVSDDPRLLRATDGAGGGSAPPAGAPPAGSGQRGGGSWQDKIRAATEEALKRGTTFGTTTVNPYASGK